MSLQFIFGASGSGKSYELYKRIICESGKHPEQNFMILVPEQFTMQTQKDLVIQQGTGIMNIDVLSFVRLAHRIFEEVGGDDRIMLDDVGKNLLLRRAASLCGEDLKILGRNLKKTGYISEIKSVISEFTQYDISPEELNQLIEKLDTQNSLYWKLLDIQKLYLQFRACLEKTYITKEELLEVLCTVVEESELLKNTTLALDGYTGFTPVQLHLLRELLRHCRNVFVTVTMDRKENPFIRRNSYHMFALAQEMTEKLTVIAREEKVELLEPVYMEEPVFRFRDNPELSFLEQHIFRGNQARWREETEHIHIYRSGTPRGEVEAAAGRICGFIRREGLRYREIAVVASNIGAYADYVQEIFPRYGIPVFLDYKRSVLSNSFVEYIRSLLAMAAEQFSLQSVFRFLRTGLYDLNREQVDELENYVLALGIHGYKNWQRPWIRRTKSMDVTLLERVNRMRVQFVEDLEPLMQVLRKRQKTAEMVTYALYEFLVKEKLQKRLAVEEQILLQKKETALAWEYRQIYRIVINLFDQFVELLKEEPVTLDEYAQLLDAGFAEAKVGVIPPGIDQVSVGDLTRSRMTDVKAVLVLGVSDSLLPGKLTNDGLLSEWDREAFAEADMKLSAGVKEKVFEQKFYLYQNLTKPTWDLSLFYSGVDGAGKSVRPAYLVDEIQKLFPVLKVTQVQEEFPKLEEMSKNAGMEYVIRGLQDEKVTKEPLWQGIFDWYHTIEPEKLQQILRANCYRRPTDCLSQAAAQTLYGDSLQGSVTRLEQYAACPFSHFARYGLALKEREEYGFEALDFGIVLHNALERYGKKTEELGCSWAEIPKEEQIRLAKECVRESTVDYGNTVLQSSARNSWMLGRMERMMERTVWALGRQMKAGDFRPDGYELDFGSGKIDRLDICQDQNHVYVKIMDYKTGSKSFDMTALYHGLQLQLVVYLQAALKLEEKRYPGKQVVPAGIFYYQIQDPILDTHNIRGNWEESMLKTLRVDGILSESEDVIYHLDHAPGSSSLAVPLGVKKDGSISSRSRTVTEADFGTVIDFTVQKKKALEKEILAGNVDISPYVLEQKHACRFCPYQDICRFDRKVPGYEYRKYTKYKQEEILEKMKREGSL